MKIKKIIASTLVIMLSLTVFSSLGVSADTANNNAAVTEQNSAYQMFVLSGDNVKAPILQANIPTECNALYKNLRYGIARAVGNNKGAKIALHIKQNAVVGNKIAGIFENGYVNDVKISMAVNETKGVDLSQTVTVTNDVAVFDWDTITANAGFNGSTGLVSDIYLQSNADISVEAVEIYIPKKDIKSLAAGAPIYEAATPIVRR